MVEHHELIGSQRKSGIGPAVVVAEFNFINARGKGLHHRPYLPATQAVGRLSLKQRNHSEGLDVFHANYLIERSRSLVEAHFRLSARSRCCVPSLGLPDLSY